MSIVRSMKVDELLTKTLTLDPTEPVSRAIGTLERSNAYEAFAVEKNQVV